MQPSQSRIPTGVDTEDQPIRWAEDLAPDAPPSDQSAGWQVLVVDDDPEVHAATKMALYDFHFENRPLEILNAYSGEQGRTLIEQHNTIALAIIDVVMENDTAGLDLVHYVRSDLKNHLTRLVLRTGQAGQVPEDRIIQEYDIDDFKSKTELTRQKLRTMIYSALRSYRDLCQIEVQKEELERLVAQRNEELVQVNLQLNETQEHLIHSEKLASVGQLAAGVAHEINNPMGFIFSNVGTLESYITHLFRILQAYEQSEATQTDAKTLANLEALKSEIDLDYLKTDIPSLLQESKEGITRVRKIVQDLRDFSHIDSSHEWHYADLNKGIASTLNLVHSEIVHKADLVRDFGDLPDVECIASQINQVVLNLLLNALQAMGAQRGVITVRTHCEGSVVWIEVTDTGVGIPKAVLPRIFDPFYTTKPVGKGTGLGLALSYGIVQKHRGSIKVQSVEGFGTTIRVTLPVTQLGGR